MATTIQNYTIRFDATGPYYTTTSGTKSYLSPLSAAEEAGFFVEDPAQRAALLAARNPPVTSDEAAQLVAYASAHGISTTNYWGDQPGSSFVHSVGVWDANTGRWTQSLNSTGILGAIEGAVAVAVPAIIGPLITGTATIFGSGAAAGTAGAAAPSSALPAGTTATTAAVTTGGAAAATRTASALAAVSSILGGSVAGGAVVPRTLTPAPVTAGLPGLGGAVNVNTWALAALAAAAVILIARRR